MRRIIDINENWEFIKEGKSERVNLPHCWNAVDGQDGGNDYYRGTCLYGKSCPRWSAGPARGSTWNLRAQMPLRRSQ